MTVALAGRAPATFEIKSANLALVALLLKSTDLAQLGRELQERFGDMPDFFDGDPMVVDLSPLKGEGIVDFRALCALLAAFRVRPLAVRGGSAAQLDAAVLAGLVPAPDATVRAAPALEQRSDSAALEAAQAAPPQVFEASAPSEESSAAQPMLAAAAAAAAPPSGALVVDKPLRSGQRVYARGRDLVVLAMVNPGSEVIADGSVHVYAPLRGKAIAGARGNTDARIFTLALDAELLSIAGVYRTSEAPLPRELHGKPAQIHLAGGDRLVMQPLNP